MGILPAGVPSSLVYALRAVCVIIYRLFFFRHNIIYLFLKIIINQSFSSLIDSNIIFNNRWEYFTVKRNTQIFIYTLSYRNGAGREHPFTAITTPSSHTFSVLIGRDKWADNYSRQTCLAHSQKLPLRS